MSTARPPLLRQLWIGALTGPVAWSVHFLTVYGLVEVACNLNTLTAPLGVAGLSTVAAIILVMTVVAVLVIMYGGWLAYAQWRRLEAEAPPERRGRGPHPRAKDQVASAHSQPEGAAREGTARDMERFMAVGGLLLSGLFTFVTLATGLPALVLAPCQ